MTPNWKWGAHAPPLPRGEQWGSKRKEAPNEGSSRDRSRMAETAWWVGLRETGPAQAGCAYNSPKRPSFGLPVKTVMVRRSSMEVGGC